MVNLLIKFEIFFLRSYWFTAVTLLGYKISFQIYWIWGWHSACWSKISSNTIQTTINCLCRENLWLDSWQFKKRIVSTIGFMHSGESYWAYLLHIWKSCSIGFECIFLSLKHSTTELAGTHYMIWIQSVLILIFELFFHQCVSNIPSTTLLENASFFICLSRNKRIDCKIWTVFDFNKVRSTTQVIAFVVLNMV